MKFTDRIEKVLGGRKLYPWASALHVSNTAANRMKQGVIPGSEILSAICRTENVSLSWLVEGKGNPFIVTTYKSDKELAAELSRHFEDAHYSVALIYDGQELVVELSEASSLSYKNKWIDFIDYQYLSAPLGEQTRRLLLTEYAVRAAHWQECYLDPERMNQLQKGELGPFHLYGNAKILGKTEKFSIDTEDDLLRILDACQQPATATGEISIPLMRSVIKMVRQLAEDEGEVLDLDDEARIVAAAYKHAVKKKLSPNDLDPDAIQGMLDIL